MWNLSQESNELSLGDIYNNWTKKKLLHTECFVDGQGDQTSLWKYRTEFCPRLFCQVFCHFFF
jgi:hypothetical protein